MALQEFNFADLVTFTRASTGTFVGSNGLIQTAAIDEPRFQYDPITLARKGLLVESQRTNIIAESEDFSGSSWNRVNISVTSDVHLAPDGTVTADTLQNAASGNARVEKNVTLTNGETYTYSLFVKPGNQDFVRMSLDGLGDVVFDASVGSFQSGSPSLTSGFKRASNGFLRLWFSGVSSFTGVSTLRIRAGADTVGTPNASIIAWGAQLESGNLSSYIKTQGATVTRLADVAQADFQTNPTLAAAFLANQGTWYIDVNDAQDAELFTGIGHWNKYTGSGTIVFRYDANDAYLHIPGSYPIRFGRDTVAAGIMDFIKDNLGVVGRVRYEDFMVTEAEAEAATAGTLEALFFIDDAHRAATSFNNAYSSKQVELIPSGIFEQSPNVTSFISVFLSNQITSIPTGLFDNNPSVESFQTVFRNNQLTSIPTGLFDNNPNVVTYFETFRLNQLTSIPAGLFDNNPNVTSFGATFSDNTLTSIPAGLFDNNPNVTSFIAVFASNPISTIPVGLFDNNTNVTSFFRAFRLCSVTDVPAGLFDTQTVCVNYGEIFSAAPNALTQQSVENVLVSINTSAQANNLDNGTLGIRGDGSALSSAAQTAKTALEGRGWVITLENIA